MSDYVEDYSSWSLDDWEWAIASWDEISVGIDRDGLIDEAWAIELTESKYNAGDLKGRALVEQLHKDVAEAAKRLGCEGPEDFKWE